MAEERRTLVIDGPGAGLAAWLLASELFALLIEKEIIRVSEARATLRRAIDEQRKLAGLLGSPDNERTLQVLTALAEGLAERFPPAEGTDKP